MKSWQTIILSISIIAGCLLSAGYLKYQPDNRLETNKGPVLLGEIYSEQILVDASIRLTEDGTDDIVSAASFYDKSIPINSAMIRYVGNINKARSVSDPLSYNDIVPLKDGAKFTIRTYIAYTSSHFDNLPYQFTIMEKEYDLPKNVDLKKSINKAIQDNYEAVTPEIAEYLFITDKKKLTAS